MIEKKDVLIEKKDVLIEKKDVLKLLQRKRAYYLKNTENICEYILTSLPNCDYLTLDEEILLKRNINLILNDSRNDEVIITNLMTRVQNE